MIAENEIEKAFEGTNFGENPKYKQIIIDTLLKLTVGFSTGKTAIAVCSELGLLTSEQKPTSKGFSFMRDNYDLIRPRTYIHTPEEVEAPPPPKMAKYQVTYLIDVVSKNPDDYTIKETVEAMSEIDALKKVAISRTKKESSNIEWITSLTGDLKEVMSALMQYYCFTDVSKIDCFEILYGRFNTSIEHKSNGHCGTIGNGGHG